MKSSEKMAHDYPGGPEMSTEGDSESLPSNRGATTGRRSRWAGEGRVLPAFMVALLTILTIQSGGISIPDPPPWLTGQTQGAGCLESRLQSDNRGTAVVDHAHVPVSAWRLERDE